MAGEVHDESAHRARGIRHESVAIGKLDDAAVREAHVELVHERRRADRTGGVTLQLPPGEPSQLRIQRGKPFVGLLRPIRSAVFVHSGNHVPENAQSAPSGTTG